MVWSRPSRLCLLWVALAASGLGDLNGKAAQAADCSQTGADVQSRADCPNTPVGLRRNDGKADAEKDKSSAPVPAAPSSNANSKTGTNAAAPADTNPARNDQDRHPDRNDAHARRSPCLAPYCLESANGDRTIFVPTVVEQKTVVIQPAAPPLSYREQRMTRDGFNGAGGADVAYPLFEGGDSASVAFNAWIAQNTASCGTNKGGAVRQNISVLAFGAAVILRDEGSAACDGAPHGNAWSRDVFFDAQSGRPIDLDQNLSNAGRAYLQNKIAEVAMRLPPGDPCRTTYLSEQPLAYNFYVRSDGTLGLNPAYAQGVTCDAIATIALAPMDMAAFYSPRSPAAAVFATLQR